MACRPCLGRGRGHTRKADGRPPCHLTPAARVAAVIAILLLGGRVSHSQATAPASSESKAADSAKRTEETWRVLFFGKTRAGYEHRSVDRFERDGQTVLLSVDEAVLSFSRFGQTLTTRTIQRTEEAADGSILKLEFELQNPPAGTKRNVAVVQGNELVVEESSGDQRTTRRMAWTGELKSPAAANRELARSPWKSGEVRTIRIFDPHFLRECETTFTAGDEYDTPLLAGARKRLRKVTILQSLQPTPIDEFLDAQGVSHRTELPALQISSYLCTQAEALKAQTGAAVDLGLTTLVKVAGLERPHEAKQITYRVTLAGGDPAPLFAVGPTQQVKSIDANTAEVTVRSLRFADPFPTERMEPPGGEYLGGNRLLQKDDARVRQHAKTAAGDEPDPAAAVLKMEKWVSDNLQNKNFSTLFASAAEVARDLSGDCTEHAVLLAAMARTREIPSRVAVGLVYAASQRGFGGHMWTEVFVNGAWLPLDATLGTGGLGAGHLKFADYSFADSGPPPESAWIPLVSALSRMKIEVVSAETTR
jgi:transglutaminase-like putative cysteine protease